MLLIFPEEEKRIELRDETAALVIQWVNQNLSFTITIGQGDAASTLEELRRSYEIAGSMLQYKAVLGTGRVILPEEITRPQTKSHEYFHTIYSFAQAFRLPDHEWDKHLNELIKQIRDSISSRKEIESLLQFLHQHLDRVFLELSKEYRNVWKETEKELLQLEQHCETVEELQADLDQWLVYYNTERPHHGYRNMGKRPNDTVELYLQARSEPAQATADGLDLDLPVAAARPGPAANAPLTT